MRTESIPQSEFKKYDTKHLKEDPFIETKKILQRDQCKILKYKS